MEKRELTCIGCPMGCLLTVEKDEIGVQSITGYTCKRGRVYGEKEVTNPTRIVTTTVRVQGGVHPVVPVKTSSDIPKAAVYACMEAIRTICPKAPVDAGEILAKNIAGTGANLIATASCKALETCRNNPN
ncbi:MAG: DUF1667 domain-containing protein [Fusicatenibacter sp.]